VRIVESDYQHAVRRLSSSCGHSGGGEAREGPAVRVSQSAPRLASFLVTKKKTDVKTAQRSMRHARSTTMLDHYTQTDMDELIAAQEMMLDAIFSHASGAVQ